MDRKGISGGLIGMNSFLLKEDRNEIKKINLRIASVLKTASNEGLQSLYADSEDTLEKYEGTDVIRLMSELSGEKLLWVRARAIDADTVNANGDFFSKSELLKEVDMVVKDKDGKTKKSKAPAYKTFEGVPIYANHKNDDILESKGMVVHAEWNEEENCVYVVFYIDESTYPDIARGIRIAYLHDVSMGCFPAGTRVLTNGGWRSIENICPDEDKLIDVNGNFTNIINKQIKHYQGDMYTFSIEGGLDITATSEHPFLIYKKADWARRKKRVGVGKYRKWVEQSINSYWSPACDLQIGDIVLTSIKGSIIDVDLNINRARLIGYFLAEGSFNKNNGKHTQVQFNFALDEENTLVAEVQQLIQEEFNLHVTKTIRKDKNLCVLSIAGQEFVNWILSKCGEYSNGKRLDNSLLFCDIELQKHILGAWLSGDGYLRKLIKRPNSNTISGCTVSRVLSQQLAVLLNRSGIIHSKRACINGKGINFNKGLKIEDKYIGDNGKKTAYYFDISSAYSALIDPYTCFNGTYNTKHQNDHYNNFLCRPITKISVLPFDGLVFNFETESNTYQVNEIVAHNCQVQSGVCSECGHEAAMEKDYCDCLKNHKGKNHPKSGKKVYEKNKGLKFIELSVVGDGAFETCSIEEIYNPDEVLQMAITIEKHAESIHSSIMLAASISPLKDKASQMAYENYMRNVAATTNSVVKVAQTLVGGPIMAGEGAGQNATVQNILHYLGIDATAGLNVLDMLNLALNFLEVAVINMFARKDNVDLVHVSKISKAMADLQATMQDLIDDGIDTGGGNKQPLNQNSLQQGQQPAPQQVQSGVPQEYAPAGNVGQAMTQNQAFVLPPEMQQGPPAAFATTKGRMVIWAHKEESE